MPQSSLGPYQVAAFNTAKDSENKIHDDAVAPPLRLFGRAGAGGRGLRLYDPSAGSALGPRLARTRRRRMPAAETRL